MQHWNINSLIDCALQFSSPFSVALRHSAERGLILEDLDHTQRRLTFGRTPLDE